MKCLKTVWSGLLTSTHCSRLVIAWVGMENCKTVYCIGCLVVCKIVFCSEFPDIPDNASKKTTTRRRSQAIAKRYAFHANAIRLIYNSFFKWRLSYCPLIWTFCCRRSNHLINTIQEQALKIASYNDFNSSFSEPLENANESTIHIRNLNFLLTEVCKFLNGLSPR